MAPSNLEEARGRLVRSASLITLLTLLSRITGYARSRAIAAVFGAGMASDAILAAFRIPNLFRQLVAEGALPGVFIPTYAQRRKTGSVEEARLFVSRIVSALTFLVAGLTVLGIVFAPAIVRLLAKGFASTPGKLELTIFLTRLMFPYLLFISVAALLQAVLNAHGRFAVSALSPILLNLSVIAFATLAAPRFAEPTVAVAIGVLVGGLLQMGIQVPAVLALKAAGPPSMSFRDPAVRGVFVLLVPRLFGFGIYAINIALSTRFASAYGDGAVSYLTFASQVVELVRGGFVISVATAILPLLAHQALEEDRRPFKDTLRFGLRMVAFVTIPWAALLIVLREPLIGGLFEGGRFGAADTEATAGVLAFYAVGLFFVSTNSILVGGHYARKDTRTPVLCATADLVVFVAMTVAFRFAGFGVASIALASSCGAAVNTLLLFAALRAKEGLLGGRVLLAGVFRAGLSAAVMAGALAWLTSSLLPLEGDGGLASRLLLLTAVILLAALFYLGTALLLRAPEPREFLSLLTRRPPTNRP